MSETHEHLEQAEHAGHGADPFTLRVAMTMAIIAAVLAAIALVGHRKHNEALQRQGDVNRLLTYRKRLLVGDSFPRLFAALQCNRFLQKQPMLDQ